MLYRHKIENVLRTNLLTAREAVRETYEQKNLHWRYHPSANPYRNNPYQWCSIGWERNNYRGRYVDIPNALRPFVPNGDLTGWWQEGRSRGEMVGLFTAAIDVLPKDLAA